MPRLMMFAACEKVIIGQEDNASTLMSILQGFEVHAEPPADQVVQIPIHWYVFTLWERLPEDVPESDIQRIQLFAPDSTVLLSAEIPIITSGSAEARFHRAALRRDTFAVKGIHDHVLRLSIKSGNGNFVEIPHAVFPIPITVRVPEPAITQA